MSQENLTARYRPQTFEAVVGQDALKRILSRSASLGRIAPAYLLSGTRGVGKTTMARIFAKAINCVHGPSAEPCNACALCQQITRGAAVDVVEIDGASNTGVDHVRRLKEDVGYAPLESRYKVIIIDEAHMLSRAAFNALLKTLEEPPGHVTFILATTEPEKFPQTIISRCQHLVFKRLPQNILAEHLTTIVHQEQVEFEPAAINLLARRGAGSVRDSMSLLAQVLALGSEVLTLADVREVLGLAGQEVYLRLVGHILKRDILGLQALLTEILDQGLDLGFFLRELVACWRNLFLLGQLSEQAQDIIDLPKEELDLWVALAKEFDLAHVHAAWQMTLESQRKVLTSMEPALVLELLLLNLAFLPQLLSLESMSIPSAGQAQAGSAPQKADPQGPGLKSESRPDFKPQPKSSVANQVREPSPPPLTPAAPKPTQAPRPAEQDSPLSGPKTWEGFVAYCQQPPDQGRAVLGLDKCQGQRHEQELVISSAHSYLCTRLEQFLPRLSHLAREYFGQPLKLRIVTGAEVERPTRNQLLATAKEDEQVQEVQEIFQAKIMHARPLTKNNSKEKTNE